MHVYYVKSGSTAKFASFIEENDNILGVRIAYPESLAEPMNIIFAIYEGDVLKEIKSVPYEDDAEEVYLPEAIVLKEGEQLKVFGFAMAESETERRPLLRSMEYSEDLSK